MDRFYSPTGVLRQGVYNSQAGAKQFEIATPALARYYLTQFTSGIRQIQMLIEGARERDSPNGGHIVECPRASFIYWFTNDSQVSCILSAIFLSILTSFLAFYYRHIESTLRFPEQNRNARYRRYESYGVSSPEQITGIGV